MAALQKLIRRKVDRFHLRRAESILAPYQLRRLVECHTAVNGFHGKRILEIGSDPKLGVEQALVRLGAREVMGVNPLPSFGATDTEQIKTLRIGAEKLAAHIPENTYDIALGIAVLEHIRPLKESLKNLHRILKPSGLAFLYGWPLWTAYHGHHLVVDGHRQKYRFHGRKSVNPIPPWGHLLMDREEMKTYLLSRDLPEDDVQKIVPRIYDQTGISRRSYPDVRDTVHASGFEVLTWKTDVRPPADEKALQSVVKKHGGAPEDYCVQGVETLLRKPCSSRGLGGVLQK